MIGLKDILHGIPVKDIVGSLSRTVKSVCFDSRKVVPDCLFVAIDGIHQNGHDFIIPAIASGSTAVLCQDLPEFISENVTYIVVDNPSFALGVAAANFYGNPSKKIKLVGVTGTNGKTTVATLLYQLFVQLGYRAGLISTVNNIIGTVSRSANYTTPDPLEINLLLSEMVEDGCDYCFMEVSSHAIVQQRIAGLDFAGGIFTNLTHDHLDFHGTFDHYIQSKKSFFDGLGKSAFALYNQDDKHGKVMIQNTFAYKKSFALRSMADFKAKVMETHFEGTLLQIDQQEVWVKLVGDFNASNILATYSVAILLEQETMKVLTALSQLKGAEGRFETMISPSGVIAIVDYAHTPDAVENVLQTIAQLKKKDEKVISVLGCGGDRDKSKRPEMARAALSYSDTVILTSDNPRTEDPGSIIRDMEAGIPAEKKKFVFSITDRKEAIRAAIHLAQSGDIVLVAGKGHEKYQEIMKERFPFDDKLVLKEAFNEQ